MNKINIGYHLNPPPPKENKIINAKNGTKWCIIIVLNELQYLAQTWGKNTIFNKKKKKKSIKIIYPNIKKLISIICEGCLENNLASSSIFCSLTGAWWMTFTCCSWQEVTALCPRPSLNNNPRDAFPGPSCGTWLLYLPR